MALIPYFARIQFDFGARALLDAELAELGVKRPLVVSDQGVAASGMLARALESIEGKLDCTLYDRVPSNPTLVGVEQALELYRVSRCDGIVAVGGGSPIDTAKAVALLATHPGPLAQYRVELNGAAKITAPVAPLIAIPTTAGTGSEIGRGMGIELEPGEAKAVFRHQNFIPKVAICDPELTLSMPPRITAGTGVDALSHCLEGYLSPALNPPLDAIALDGIARIAKYLPRAVHEGGDREARWEVMMGALEGGMCMTKGLGPAHALSIPLDSLDLHHGTVVGVLLPETVRFLEPAIGDKLVRLASVLGLANADQVSGYLASLNARIGLPPNLAQMGVTEALLAPAAASAAASSFNLTSARRASADDYLALLRNALQ